MREEGGPYGLEIDGPADEEALLQAIRERGFELIPFEDHVAFRFAYESKFRSHWDRGKCTDLVVVLRAERHDLSTLPYDLLQAGRQLSFNLGELFPNLSYPVIASLDRSDLDALYSAQSRHNPDRLGDNATSHFQVPLRRGVEIVRTANQKLSGIEKTYRFIMSHRTGKIEIIDLDDRGHLHMRYHQCKDLDKIGRIFSLACPKDAQWLDDLYTDE